MQQKLEAQIKSRESNVRSHSSEKAMIGSPSSHLGSRQMPPEKGSIPGTPSKRRLNQQYLLPSPRKDKSGHHVLEMTTAPPPPPQFPIFQKPSVSTSNDPTSASGPVKPDPLARRGRPPKTNPKQKPPASNDPYTVPIIYRSVDISSYFWTYIRPTYPELTPTLFSLLDPPERAQLCRIAQRAYETETARLESIRNKRIQWEYAVQNGVHVKVPISRTRRGAARWRCSVLRASNGLGEEDGDKCKGVSSRDPDKVKEELREWVRVCMEGPVMEDAEAFGVFIENVVRGERGLEKCVGWVRLVGVLARGRKGWRDWVGRWRENVERVVAEMGLVGKGGGVEWGF